MLLVSCRLLKCSRGVSQNWGCMFGRSTESHRDTSGCRDLRRLCCISPGDYTWDRLVHFVCPWSHIWALLRNSWLVLSKRWPKNKHWCSVDAQQTRTEDDLEKWAIAWCRCVERMGLPWAARGIKTGRGFHQLGQWKGHVYPRLLSQAEWRCITGSGPALPPPGISSTFPL